MPEHEKQIFSPLPESTGIRPQQIMVKAVIARGGNSRGVYLLRSQLPADPALRDKIILAIFGSPDIREIDGLGGATVLTSKVAILGPSTRPDADIDYTFGQVSINEAHVDYSGNCGNISAGVGPVAIHLGLIDKKEPITSVRMHLTNFNRILKADVPVMNDEVLVEGDYQVAGVPGTGAKIELDFCDSGGASTGKILPTGNAKDTIKIDGIGDLDVSIVDAGNPIVFVRASSIGLKGTESPNEIKKLPDKLSVLEKIRSVAAQKLGFVDDWRKATEDSPFIPFVVFLSAPQNYISFTTKQVVSADSIDIVARQMLEQNMHEAYAGTAAVCTGTAARIPGTLVNDLISKSICATELIRIGNPSGIFPINTVVEANGGSIHLIKASFGRTARIIMEGYVYVRKSLLI